MMNDWNNITIYLEENGDRKAAETLSRQLGVPIANSIGEALTLVFDGTGLSLVGYGMRYQGDFARMLNRVTKGRLHHEMLVKIAKTKTDHPVAVDAAAGMGEDSFLLAAAGYEVYLFEQDAVIAALMPQLTLSPEIVYLDPMFPPRKKSGLIQKKLQLIQKLEQPCANEQELYDAAAALHPKKIIIKRPLNGALLADKKPSYTVKGKAIRYDVVVL